MLNNRVFRWIAVIPGAFVAAIAAMFPWHWVVMLYANVVGIYEGEEHIGLGLLVRSIGPENVERAGYGFFTPLLLIVVAARIAPKYKLMTAVTVAFLIVAGLSSIEFIMWWRPLWLMRTLDVVPTLFANLLTMFAVFVAFKYARPWWELGKLPADNSDT